MHKGADEKVLAQLNIPQEKLSHIENDIKAAEDELDDDAESIITNDRYVYIAELIKGCYKRRVPVSFHHLIRLTELLQTDGWDFRYSQL